ncbi:MAG TPA: FHA domain-containing protein [bacterium]|nr:FHA domain-containing protein [bacterium]HOL66123.1 FHA domain-containing protein [bacterium]HPP13027.1 FHA domain-containing protein [bacterium]
MAKLIFNYPFMMREYPLTKDRITVGRLKEHDIIIPDYRVFRSLNVEIQRQLVKTLAKVSRFHARLDRINGIYHVVDVGTGGAGSSYGTYVNGLRLETGKPYLLKSGDRIRFGPIECTFEEEKDEKS